MRDCRTAAAIGWRTLAVTLAGMIGVPSHAAVLTYEYDPGPLVHTGFRIYDGACEDYQPVPGYDFSCGETLDLTALRAEGVNPLLSFDTDVMPFDIRGKRLRISSEPTDYDGFEGVLVLDWDGSQVFEIAPDDYYDVFSLPWLVYFTIGIPFTTYDLWFDENGLVTNWYVNFDNDPSGASFWPEGANMSRHLDNCDFDTDEECEYAFYASDRPGEWLINGVPQSELVPAPVPLPVPLGLLAAAAGLLPLLRARRAARR